MLVLLFRSIEEATNKLSIIREELMKVHENYSKTIEEVKINANVESMLAKVGYRPSHRVVTIQSISSTTNVHIMPHSTWLLNKLKSVNDNISFIINEIDKVRNYLNNVKTKDVSVMIMIDYKNKKSRLVIMP